MPGAKPLGRTDSHPVLSHLSADKRDDTARRHECRRTSREAPRRLDQDHSSGASGTLKADSTLLHHHRLPVPQTLPAPHDDPIPRSDAAAYLDELVLTGPGLDRDALHGAVIA